MSVRLVANRKNGSGEMRSDKARVVDSIKSIARRLRTSGKQSEKVPGVTTAQLHVLRALASRASLSINEIAARTYTHQSSVSMVVGRLVEDKLVTRTASKTDGRSVSISLTSTGRQVLRKSEVPSEVRLGTALKTLDRSELTELANCLEKISTVLERHSSSVPVQGESLEA